MASSSTALVTRPHRLLIDRVAKSRGKRPHPIRTQSAANVDEDQIDYSQPLARTRHKSTATPNKLARLSVTPTSSPGLPFSPTYSSGGDSPRSPRVSIERARQRTSSGSTASSVSALDEAGETNGYSTDILRFDFCNVDYQLARARKLGQGLWSDVYLCELILPANGKQDDLHIMPGMPHRTALSSSAAVFAVKVPARQDAAAVLRHEAIVLTHLQKFAGANEYSIPFFGLDSRNSALVFEAVVGGSMDDMINRLKHMTEIARHQELVSIFPSLSTDLISGLAFLHDADIVHADIKPANILLDISDHYSLPTPVIRARYIDFSAAFVVGQDGDNDNPPAAGGTWDYMAPEQLKARALPTCASDVWALGISLLNIILLTSPYRAACGDNAFMLREAVKAGDPLGFARMDPTGKTRTDACQEYIDWCRLALQKDPVKRASAIGWKRWLEMHVDRGCGTVCR